MLCGQDVMCARPSCSAVVVAVVDVPQLHGKPHNRRDFRDPTCITLSTPVLVTFPAFICSVRRLIYSVPDLPRLPRVAFHEYLRKSTVSTRSLSRLRPQLAS